MDWAQLLLELGIAAVALGILHKTLIRNDRRIDSRDAAFHKFVTEHNDGMTQLMLESTNAIKESSEATKKTGTFIATATATMQEVRDHFIKSH